ncbi:DNA-binding protein [Stygiolobus caldivivus]|uniref:DNA-binding protein n=2 Tax=Stygiolobus caldivivus TaxID=2824673 RepID=A0A8D5ZEE9_9CREN|nr:DNA-binding protein [Stygiolobus caldivivus]
MDGIPLVMKYTFPAEDLYRPFWEGLKRGEVLGTRCKRCNTLYFPPQRDCPKCMGSDMEWVGVGKSGELMTYSIVEQKPQGFENYDKYTIGIVRTEKGVNLMCWVVGTPKVGAKVSLSSDGHRVLCEVKA